MLTAFAALGALQGHRWAFGWVGGVMAASLVTFLAVLIHELAHAAMAWRLGATIHKIVVLPFEFSVRSRRLRIVRRAGHGDIGGCVTYNLDRISANVRHALIAAAGPVANVATAVVVGMFAYTSTYQSSYGRYDEPVGISMAIAFMLVSIGMGLSNLIPFDHSDGMRIWRYLILRGRMSGSAVDSLSRGGGSPKSPP
ncbi:MAG: hypothetical protein J0I47_04210 [Sphingomonas sp.]|uniref:site-2 protease family protein n=1 Tax=Sphingomonas sp. TaxID=28214 RepID=UPI001AC14534|nr:site-2 protease family protein [Sphingomonas sp.]MBN8807429.1 hypothetical protein [Sphingomonas sp.]